MPNLMPGDIKDEVRQVLLQAPDAGRYARAFLTAYQILDRLPVPTRDRLIAERRLGGQGAGVYYAATSAVSDAAELLADVEKLAIDSRGVINQVAGQQIAAGAEVVAIYRLSQTVRVAP